MILTLLTFGEKLENHYQASFAILTYLKSDRISKICLLTDQPSFYKYFGNRIDIIEIDQKIMDDWRGKYDFFWRIKMKAIEVAALSNPNKNILYVDSDTFYVDNMEIIENGLNNGLSFMHENEGKLAEISSKTPQRMWKSLSGKTFPSITINKDSEMWNAGVIALSGHNACETISLAIEICDQICATNCPRRLVEQFSFSLALKQTSILTEAENIIGHYWGNKSQWNEKITEFFMYSTLSLSSMENDLKRIQEINLESLPTVYKEKNIKDKIKKLLDIIFHPKDIQYFKGKM